METLNITQLANKYASDKGTEIPNDGRHHGPRLGFSETYDKYFGPLRDKEVVLLEIGIASGPSLKIWYDFFPKGQIHAIDTAPSGQYENNRVKIYVANQSNRINLKNVVNAIGKPIDIIIDDGGHMMEQQQTSFGFLFEYLAPGGLYFIEDLHTSYWPLNGYSSLYGKPLDLRPNKANATVKMVEKFIKTKKISSEYLEELEKKYINENAMSAKLFDLGETEYGPNKLALFKKK